MISDAEQNARDHRARWRTNLRRYRTRVPERCYPIVEGKLSRMAGLTLEAVGCRSAVGGRCLIKNALGETIEAEVVGFSGERLFLIPTGPIHGLEPDCRVIPTGKSYAAHVGPALLGRVIDGAGVPLDGKGTLRYERDWPLNGKPMNPLSRKPIQSPLDVGVRAINAMITVGRGQRMGLFAGTGLGKSILLGMMARFSDADVIVVGLIGEHDREINEFVKKNLGEDALSRAVVVASLADDPPLMRMHGAMLATAIAEYFRDQGLDVLLIMDSLTRFAQAQREIALAINEPPATKGYPPSVFTKMPHLVERAGNGDTGSGSITAFYAVLAEGDAPKNPIADAARAILDGQIVLSRETAESGHFPAIDIEASVSRAFNDITNERHLALARRLRSLLSLYNRNRDFISLGAYQAGSDPRIDEAIQYYPAIREFLQQSMHERVSLAESLEQLENLFGDPGRMSDSGRSAEQKPA